MSVATGTTPDTEAGAPVETMLIDTDVHEQMAGGVGDLIPYIDPVWHRYLVPSDGEHQWPLGRSLDGGLRYAAPIGHGRREWLDDEGKADCRHVDRTQEHLFNEEGVTVAVLCGSFRPGAMRTDYEFAHALAGAYNDWLIENWLEKDKRFRGSIHVVPDLPELAVREIDRLAAHPQMVQVFMPTMHDRQYGDPVYRPIFEAAARHELAIALHHGGGTQSVIGFPRYYIEWHVLAAPQATMAQVSSILFSGVFDEFPELKLVLLEGSVGWVPWFMLRMDQQYREVRSNVPWVKRLPGDHIRDNVRFSTQPISELSARNIQSLIEMADCERCFMFSTDYPHYDADSLNVLNGLPDELRARIHYRNALETFRGLSSLAG